MSKVKNLQPVFTNHRRISDPPPPSAPGLLTLFWFVMGHPSISIASGNATGGGAAGSTPRGRLRGGTAALGPGIRTGLRWPRLSGNESPTGGATVAERDPLDLSTSEWHMTVSTTITCSALLFHQEATVSGWPLNLDQLHAPLISSALLQAIEGGQEITNSSAARGDRCFRKAFCSIAVRHFPCVVFKGGLWTCSRHTHVGSCATQRCIREPPMRWLRPRPARGSSRF